MTKTPSNTNEALTQDQQWSLWASQAQDGDKKAYNHLLSDIADYTRGFVISGLANPDWADDITQEVLISVHKSLKTYSPSKPFKPWLIAIINFRRTDFLRKHYNKRDNVKTSLDNPDFLSSYVTNPTNAGEYKDIERALESLPEQQSKVFKMIKIQGFTTKEVANEMGMSESAVKVSAHRTMKKLQDMLS